ncbi:MAG TPA: HVO_0476 family zinc finger protein [Thermoplasmata archaeon]
MAAPSALVLTCGQCGETAPHRVLRGKIGGGDEIVFEGVVKCSACDFVSSVVTREPKPIDVPLVVSWLDQSEKTSLEFSPEEDVRVGEELDLGDSRIAITAIEVGGRRVDGAKAKEVATLWAKRIDQVRVKFSVNKGNRTVPHEVLAAADEEFEIGEIVDLGKVRAVVHHIRTRMRTVRDGRVRADEIVRMYGRVVRERTSR